MASIDFLKQERVLEQLERASYDVVVIDEAHHCTDLGTAQEREDSLRRRLATVLARQCDALILATATPHDGNDRSFASLCELLDPSLVDGRGTLRGLQYKDHVVRRLKRHIRKPGTKEPMFLERKVIPVPVDAPESGDVQGFHKALLQFVGPELKPFVKFDLESELTKIKLLAKTTGAEGKELEESWRVYNRKLLELAARGGSIRVRGHVIEPLVARLGYTGMEDAPDVTTREGQEPGGTLLIGDDGARLRTWSTGFEEDLDAPAKRGTAYRYSHLRIAQRVLLASGERVGLLTNGVELRVLISDPARPDSQIVIPIDPDWKRARHDLPDSYRLLLALGRPAGVEAVPDLVDKARLKQTTVTKELRRQAHPQARIHRRPRALV